MLAAVVVAVLVAVTGVEMVVLSVAVNGVERVVLCMAVTGVEMVVLCVVKVGAVGGLGTIEVRPIWLDRILPPRLDWPVIARYSAMVILLVAVDWVVGLAAAVPVVLVPLWNE